jgi:8-oxo-dGTP pyrophosphatase MutT (NUDIX family)
MTYKISAGIPESSLKRWLEEALEKYGLYEGKAVNYTHADIAPIVMCTVRCDDEILLVKRGYGLADAEGYWSIITGFIDEAKPVQGIAKQELQEELGLTIDANDIKVAASYTLQNPKEKRQYIVFPCLIDLESKPEITLDREHTDYTWTTRDKLESFHILDDLPYAIDTALATIDPNV